jgi:hypothetical protein
MPHLLRFAIAIGLLGSTVLTAAAQPKAPPPAVSATIETTWSTEGKNIRQFAFDGDADSYFASREEAGLSDHFTLTFDKPVTVRSITVTTGKPDGDDALDEGTLEVLGENKKWEELAKFTEGVASAKPHGRRARAVRIRPASDLDHPLAIREFAIESDPPVAVFRYPVEFVVNVDDAPEMKAWAEKVARICERAYPMINDELQSEGFKPATVVTMTLKNDLKYPAATSGSRIVGSVKHFTARPDDVGAMVHETVHVCQRYRGRAPGWLVEGIADYIRFFKYEPGKLGRLSPNRAKYDGSYQVTARFLAYVSDKYDKELVRKLNKSLREGEYKEEIFQQLTKKPLKQLNEEWRASLAR